MFASEKEDKRQQRMNLSKQPRGRDHHYNLAETFRYPEDSTHRQITPQKISSINASLIFRLWCCLSKLAQRCLAPLAQHQACSVHGSVPLVTIKVFITMKLFSNHKCVFIFMCAITNWWLLPSNDINLLLCDVLRSFALFMWPWFNLH